MKIRPWVLWAAIALLTALPLWLASATTGEPSAAKPLAFLGADERARQAIVAIAPDYQPWFSPVFEPASGEIASLLFALQAAIGAGMIGFWLGLSVARQRALRLVAAELTASKEEHRAD